ncbi:MAG: Na+/Ca+ antiporter, CaCA family [Candidatus Collierbacteria bacterium GW2011_GWF2_44_15]|uniref:Na+/Ca+ antiporter, CaCA family n=2 Tax=Candidatus Collieribacteriota TaxID=1752725 RepID=A0A0G1KDT9_9BACT|nr:MAG: Na+/Ca+ antiporter, CaCA family [Candidatus Collierbacteria bacterium GW2011_GWF2_44_15]KKU29147.1 MAG: Na+/Ca+ antiporter, CaCA family [Candidatus Collierbacteria bacterium GW2011_GWE1_46_18]
MLANLLIGGALVAVMVLATGIAIDQFEKLSTDIKVKKLLLATVIIGLSTSLPELFITVTSGLSGEPQIALGDLMGANIANLSWVIGGAALVGKAIPVVGEYIREDLWITMILAMAPFLLMIDGTLGRFDGVILIFGYLLYLSDLVEKGRYRIKQAKLEKHVISKHHLKTIEGRLIHIVKMTLSLAVLGVAAAKLVGVAVNIAHGLGASTFWVGLIVVALGTTLPEVIVSLEAVKRREASLILGNLLGSVVVNSSLIMGIGAVLSPVIFDDTLTKGISGIFMVVVLGLFWLFTKTKHRLDRWEGGVLVGIYLMFVGIQFLALR